MAETPARARAAASAAIVASAASIAAANGLHPATVYELMILRARSELVAIYGELPVLAVFARFVDLIGEFARMTPAPTRH